MQYVRHIYSSEKIKFMFRPIFSFTIPLLGVPRVGQENCGDVTRVGMIYESDVPGWGYSNGINWYFLMQKGSKNSEDMGSSKISR